MRIRPSVMAVVAAFLAGGLVGAQGCADGSCTWLPLVQDARAANVSCADVIQPNSTGAWLSSYNVRRGDPLLLCARSATTNMALDRAVVRLANGSFTVRLPPVEEHDEVVIPTTAFTPGTLVQIEVFSRNSGPLEQLYVLVPSS